MAMNLPIGFRASGVRAGIKPSGKPDVALVVGDAPLAWAFMGTKNRVAAACIDRNRALLAQGGSVRALVVNAGNANAATGTQGARDNERMALLAASALGVREGEVLTASTGVIGRPMPMPALEAGIAASVPALVDTVEPFAEAIMTTDLVMKTAAVTLPGGARIVGVAKGSGMIHPDMATMFGFVLTDAKVDTQQLRAMWARTVDRSFHQITVDGDTSTNDMAIVLASGRVACEASALERALTEVAAELARAIARDGEGATTLITAQVTGAASEVEARRAAKAIVGSSLIKSAVHGRDPNWGRILSAVGQSQVAIDLARVVITLQGEAVYRGAPLPFDASALSQLMRSPDVRVDVDLGVGAFAGTAWGCDLSAEYVNINALYTT